MMKGVPKVSIIIPVYNGANYLSCAIDSALNQTYKNCEVIVVNDGSNDEGRTENVAKSYGTKIRYFYKENGGVATAVNFGINKMEGEFFAWLSHDDYYKPDKVEKQMIAIESSGNEMSICHSNFEFLHVEESYFEKVDWLNMYPIEKMQMGIFPVLFSCIHGSGILFHRKHFDRVGLYDETLRTTQDSEFLFRLMRNQQTVFVKDSLFVSRIHSEQGSKTIRCHKKEWNEMLKAFCEKISDAEKIAMCGSVFNFYYRVRVMVNGNPKADSIIDYLEDILKKTSKEVFVFGAGSHGRRLVYDLKNRGIKVRNFIDNNVNKRGTKIEGIECVLPIDLSEQEMENIPVVMGILDDKTAILQMRSIGVQKVFTYKEISERLFMTSPIVTYNE
ncbi:MAG: glycosyltransferase [Agathobacter sp.]